MKHDRQHILLARFVYGRSSRGKSPQDVMRRSPNTCGADVVLVKNGTLSMYGSTGHKI